MHRSSTQGSPGFEGSKRTPVQRFSGSGSLIPAGCFQPCGVDQQAGYQVFRDVRFVFRTLLFAFFLRLFSDLRHTSHLRFPPAAVFVRGLRSEQCYLFPSSTGRFEPSGDKPVANREGGSRNRRQEIPPPSSPLVRDSSWIPQGAVEAGFVLREESRSSGLRAVLSLHQPSYQRREWFSLVLCR